MTEKLKSLAKFFLGIPLTIISLYFVFYYIFSTREQIIPYLAAINYLPFVVGIMFLVIFFLLRSLAWKQILLQDGYDVDTVKSNYFLMSAEVRRYIPGNILGFISRVSSFHSLNIPQRVTIKLIFYESIIFLLTSLLVSLPGLQFAIKNLNISLPFYNQTIYLPIIAIFFILVLFYLLLKNKIRFKYTLPNILRFKNAFLLMLAAWVVFGIGNYLISSSFYYLDPILFKEYSSFFVFSWLIGYIVLVVPLGLGVREAAIVYGLSNVMSAGFAATLSIILRIASIFAELFFLLLSYLIYKFEIELKVLPRNIVLWVSIIAYILYFSYFTTQKHLNFFTGKFDLGNMDQTVWNTLNGRIFMLTNPDSTETISRLAIHADFILILLAPFYLLWNDPRMLLLIQTVILALGAYVIYKLANMVLGNLKSLSLVFSISYLLNPWVQKQNLFDFHAVTLATTFLLACFYFLIQKKYNFFLLFLGLTVLTKENLYLVAFFFGFYIWYKTKKVKWIALSVAAFITFYVIISKLIPDARGSMHFALGYYEDFGGSTQEIIKNSILNPALILSKILNETTITYVKNLLIPAAFLSIAAPIFLLFALPDLLINILSSNENLRNITFHYAAVIIPFVYISAIYGAKRLLDLKIKYINPTALLILVSFFSVYATYQLGVLPGAKKPSLEIYREYLPERSQIKEFLDGIPKDLSVAASNNLGAHLSHRENIYVVPIGAANADVVVLLLNDEYAGPNVSSLKFTADELRNNPSYIELLRVGSFISFARRDIAHLITTYN